MKIFFDTEFIEDGKTIELVSIGAVREDGKTYYAECYESIHLWDTASDWVKFNVIAHLKSNNTAEYCPELKSKAEIRRDLLAFTGEKPEFWGYYADYDWVLLCQLFGKMIDLPKGWPMFCMDLKQLAVSKGITDSSQLPLLDGTEHIAIDDALWNKKTYEYLESI